ncbi:hypothetical protein NQ264_27605, partial [Escherichia coli]|nr:hypothetical protein [Escherichia coli]
RQVVAGVFFPFPVSDRVVFRYVTCRGNLRTKSSFSGGVRSSLVATGWVYIRPYDLSSGLLAF